MRKLDRDLPRITQKREPISSRRYINGCDVRRACGDQTGNIGFHIAGAECQVQRQRREGGVVWHRRGRIMIDLDHALRIVRPAFINTDTF